MKEQGLGTNRSIWSAPSDLGEDPFAPQHLHGSARRRWYEHAHIWRPPTDVYETESAIIVRVELAGMGNADFAVTLEGRWLYVRGVRQDPAERRAYHQMEIHFGEFGSEVELPAPVDSEHLEAVYQDGFLIVTLPRAKTHIIPITG